MKRRAFLQFASVLSLGALAGAGCGGGGKSSAPAKTTTASGGRGRVELTLRWPDAPASAASSRLVPQATQSVRVRLLRGTTIIGEQIIARTPTAATATFAFDNLPVGDYALTSEAFPAANAQGTLLATATVSVTVVDGQASNVRLTMASTITTLLATAPGGLFVGDTASITVTPQDASGNTVLVAPSLLRFASSDTNILTVDAAGNVTAVAGGTATITVTESESGKTANVVFTINVPPPPPDQPVPLFLYDTQRTGQAGYASSATGVLKWKFQTGNFIWASPVVGSDGTVYVASGDGIMYALDGQTGVSKWQFIAQTDPNLVMHSTAALGTDGTVFFGTQSGFVYALDGQTGAKKWEYNAGNEVNSSPLIDRNRVLYVGTGSLFGGAGSVLALDSITGTKKWEFATPTGVESSPSLAPDGTLYVGSGGFSSGMVYALDSATGAQKWAVLGGEGYESSPSIGKDGTVYIGARAGRGSGGLYALNGATGAKKWMFAAFDVRGCPSIGRDGSLFFPSSDDNIYCLKPDGTLKWKFLTGGQVKSTPVIAPNGTLYGGGKDGYLYALDAATGTKKWEFYAGDYVFSTPAIGKNGMIYITAFDGYVYALS